MHHHIRKCTAISRNSLKGLSQIISWCGLAFPDVSTNNFLMCTAISRNSLRGLSQIISWCGGAFPDVHRDIRKCEATSGNASWHQEMRVDVRKLISWCAPRHQEMRGDVRKCEATSGNYLYWHQEIIWLRPFKEFREIAVHIRKLFVPTSGNASWHQEMREHIRKLFVLASGNAPRSHEIP
jgi:hypothetical protein